MLGRRTPPSNQRQHVRRAVAIKAMLLRDTQASQPCTVVDISEAGARLVVADPKDVPDRFTIAMTEQGVPRRLCRLVWRGVSDIGVAFETDNCDRKALDRVLEPGSSLQDALDTFALQS